MAAARPQGGRVLRRAFVEAERRDLDHFDAPGQRLARLAPQRLGVGRILEIEAVRVSGRNEAARERGLAAQGCASWRIGCWKR
jgi:hypothetical protein